VKLTDVLTQVREAMWHPEYRAIPAA
jgi:hypothetical protein